MMRFLSVSAVMATLLLAVPAAHAELAIVVDKASQRMVVTIDGQQKYVWPVSTGKVGHFTPVGDFKPFRMEIDHKSEEFDDAPMPHSVFFTRQGHAIHGSFNTKQLGMVASSGCVRLAPANAALLFGLVKKHGLNATKIKIDGDERVAIAAARRNGKYRGPDPDQIPPQQAQALQPAQQASVWPNPFAPFAERRPEQVAAPVAPQQQPRSAQRQQPQAQARPRRETYVYDERVPRRYYAEEPVQYYGTRPAQPPQQAAYPRYYRW